MDDLEEYYQRFYQVLQDDLEAMLTEVDPAKRSPKAIADRLKLAEECQVKIKELQDTGMSDWDRLSPATQRKIEELILQDQDSKRIKQDEK